MSSVLRKTRLNGYNNVKKLTNETFEKIQHFRKGLPENQKMPLENLLRPLLKKYLQKIIILLQYIQGASSWLRGLERRLGACVVSAAKHTALQR